MMTHKVSKALKPTRSSLHSSQATQSHQTIRTEEVRTDNDIQTHFECKQQSVEQGQVGQVERCKEKTGASNDLLDDIDKIRAKLKRWNLSGIEHEIEYVVFCELVLTRYIKITC